MKEKGTLQSQPKGCVLTMEQCEHGKILDVFPMTFMNAASTMEMTKNGKLADT